MATPSPLSCGYAITFVLWVRYDLCAAIHAAIIHAASVCIGVYRGVYTAIDTHTHPDAQDMRTAHTQDMGTLRPDTPLRADTHKTSLPLTTAVTEGPVDSRR